MKAIVFVLLTTLPLSVVADGQADQNAGVCAAYLTATERKSAVALALNMADNQNRALQHGMNWINSVKRMNGEKATIQYAFVKADGMCREIGIRPADYKN